MWIHIINNWISEFQINDKMFTFMRSRDYGIFFYPHDYGIYFYPQFYLHGP